ncbi:MAG: hypothetical protein ABW067_08850 [Rhizobacter sp.]
MNFRRLLVVFALLTLHAMAVAFVGALPEHIGPALAATVYLPLWPLSALGLPVFGPTPSGGWAGPSVLGWGLWLVAWAVLWSIPVLLLAAWRGRSRHLTA